MDKQKTIVINIIFNENGIQLQEELKVIDGTTAESAASAILYALNREGRIKYEVVEYQTILLAPDIVLKPKATYLVKFTAPAKTDELQWTAATVKEWPPSSFMFKKGGCLHVPYLNIAGLVRPEQTASLMKLYMREQSMEQLSFLTDCEQPNQDTNTRECRGVVIQGAPGTGKSCTTWAWLLQRVNKQSVLWVHAVDNMYKCVRMSRSGIEQCRSAFKQQIMMLLTQACEDIVVLDGLIGTNPAHGELVGALQCPLMAEEDIPCRFTIQVPSLAFISSSVFVSHQQLSIRTLRIYPWTLAEYKLACNDRELFESVASFLGGNDYSKRDELVERKFDSAGASARWMFASTVSEIISQTRDAIERAGNLNDVFKLNNREKSQQVSKFTQTRSGSS